MLNENKIKVMTYLAKEEKKEHNEEFRIMNFYKYDYIRYNLIKNFLSVTVGYVMLLALAALYKADYLIANLMSLDLKELVVKVIVIYLVLLIVYSAMTVWLGWMKYEKSKDHVEKYYKLLDVLQKFYEREMEQK